MKAILFSLLFVGCAFPAAADPVAQLMDGANQRFDRLPVLRIVDRIAGRCGADHDVNNTVAYCTSENVVYLTRAGAGRPEAAYLVAHVLGHATQVRHGVADVALRTIRANRDQEAALRADVTRQVECLAGYLYRNAGLPPAELTDWFQTEPFADAHWGRNPLTVGPKVSIGLQERAAWFARGQGGNLADCATDRFGAELLLAAVRG